MLHQAQTPAEVAAAAAVIDDVVLVAAAEAPKTELEVSVALLEEAKASRLLLHRLCGQTAVCDSFHVLDVANPART